MSRVEQLSAAWALERQMLLGVGASTEVAAAVQRTDRAVAAAIWHAGPELERRLAAAEQALLDALSLTEEDQ
jgi:hypothetical protein